jgi:hypothetical protein
LAFGIVKMDGLGGLAGWRWIFVLEGVATIILGIISFFGLPADLASASFLSEDERRYASKSKIHSQPTTWIKFIYLLVMYLTSTPGDSIASEELEGKPSDICAEELRSRGEDETFEMREVWRGRICCFFVQDKILPFIVTQVYAIFSRGSLESRPLLSSSRYMHIRCSC